MCPSAVDCAKWAIRLYGIAIRSSIWSASALSPLPRIMAGFQLLQRLSVVGESIFVFGQVVGQRSWFHACLLQHLFVYPDRAVVVQCHHDSIRSAAVNLFLSKAVADMKCGIENSFKETVYRHLFQLQHKFLHYVTYEVVSQWAQGFASLYGHNDGLRFGLADYHRHLLAGAGGIKNQNICAALSPYRRAFLDAVPPHGLRQFQRVNFCIAVVSFHC